MTARTTLLKTTFLRALLLSMLLFVGALGAHAQGVDFTSSNLTGVDASTYTCTEDDTGRTCSSQPYLNLTMSQDVYSYLTSTAPVATASQSFPLKLFSSSNYASAPLYSYIDASSICNQAAASANIPTSGNVYCVVTVDWSLATGECGLSGIGGGPVCLNDGGYIINETADLFTSPPTTYTDHTTDEQVTGYPDNHWGASQPPSSLPSGDNGCISTESGVDAALNSGPDANVCLVYTGFNTGTPPATATISASPSTIATGNSSTLTYECKDATSGSINGIGNVTADGQPHQLVVSPTATTNYTLTCSGPGGSGTASATVTVVPPPAPTCSLSASTTSITQGGSSQLTWSSTNTTDTEGSHFTTGGAVSGTGSVSPTTTTTYQVTCTGPGGSTTSPPITVVVTPPTTPPPPPPSGPTCSLFAQPGSIVAGRSSTLTWSSTNTTSTEGVKFHTAGTVSGSETISPTTTTTYRVICTGPGGTSTSAPVTITVSPPATAGSVTAACSVSPTTATVGEPVTWTAIPSGGNGTYAYSWSGTGGLTGSTQSVTTSYASSGEQTGEVTVTSGGQTSGTIDCSNSVTVAPQLPDITSTVAPAENTAVVGVAQTFDGTNQISNIGGGAASSFPNVLDIEGASGAHLKYVAASDLSLAPGASGSISAAYTFAAKGTYQVRWCGNMNTSGTNIITESNYGNNCGPKTTVTVVAAGQGGGGGGGASVSCTPSPSTAAPGDSITWTATPSGFSGPVSYSWSDTAGSPAYGSGSTYTNSYAAAGNYSPNITATDSYGDTASASCIPVTITGNGSGAACTVGTSPYIKATPNLVNETNNTGVTLSWSAAGVAKGTSCTISGPALRTITTHPAGSQCLIATSTATTGEIITQSIYTINCGGIINTAVVNVTPAYNEY